MPRRFSGTIIIHELRFVIMNEHCARKGLATVRVSVTEETLRVVVQPRYHAIRPKIELVER